MTLRGRKCVLVSVWWLIREVRWLLVWDEVALWLTDAALSCWTMRITSPTRRWLFCFTVFFPHSYIWIEVSRNCQKQGLSNEEMKGQRSQKTSQTNTSRSKNNRESERKSPNISNLSMCVSTGCHERLSGPAGPFTARREALAARTTEDAVARETKCKKRHNRERKKERRLDCEMLKCNLSLWLPVKNWICLVKNGENMIVKLTSCKFKSSFHKFLNMSVSQMFVFLVFNVVLM